MWVSRNQGKTWTRTRRLTRGSARNHSYARTPVNAHPGFYALWADGDAKKPSESDLFYTDRAGTHAWRLPPAMTGEFVTPAVAW